MRPLLPAPAIALVSSLLVLGGCGGEDQPDGGSAREGSDAGEGVTQRNEATIEQSQEDRTQQSRQRLESSSRSNGGSHSTSHS